MNQIFLQITLKQSQQVPSCITLENWVDQLKNPDFRENLKKCNDQNQMINLFPIVGYGLQITFKQQLNILKIKVNSISQVEKIIDLTTIQLDKKNLTRDRPNCILPLLKKEEKNEELLKCELFREKMSYLITQNHEFYDENSYIKLIQSTLKYLIKVNNNSQWQQEMIQEIFEVCEQVFIEQDIYKQSIQNQEFKTSQYQLLNVFCLFRKNNITPEEIYNEFILPKIQNLGSFQLNDEGQTGIGKFFDSLNLNYQKIDFDDINGNIRRYLDENDYFYTKLFYGQFLRNLIQFFIPKEMAKDKLRKEMFFQCQDEFEENQFQQQKHLIINFTQSVIYKHLFNMLLNDYSEQNKIKYFQSLNQAIEIGNYYSFLQRQPKYEDLAQYYNLNTHLSHENSYDNGLIQFIQYIVQLLLKQISILELRKISFESWEQMRQSQKIIEKSTIIQKYAIIFGIKPQHTQLVEDEILNTISEICWLNCESLKINYQNDVEIINYLKMIKNYPQCDNLKQYFHLHQKCLNEISQFCFKIKSQTQLYKYFDYFETNELNNKLPKDPRKANNFLKIYQVCKNMAKV
ncbi:unnamed protein product [Paramecium primaurelia]|uniref:Uncharacterized protein n=1 Tax=Paramecium primaurelia TaxID=5886 RepID=A0A8S1KF27_PARPR|nr:unnamed protein product [Paramecium primaurelia]